MKTKTSKRAKALLRPGSIPNRSRADQKWKLAIHMKWKGRCGICRRPGRDAHHIIGRDNMATRHDLRNGMLLCFTHHQGRSPLSVKHHPAAFTARVKLLYPGTYQWVMAQKCEPIKKPDYIAAAERLERYISGELTEEQVNDLADNPLSEGVAHVD